MDIQLMEENTLSMNALCVLELSTQPNLVMISKLNSIFKFRNGKNIYLRLTGNSINWNNFNFISDIALCKSLYINLFEPVDLSFLKANDKLENIWIHFINGGTINIDPLKNHLNIKTLILSNTVSDVNVLRLLKNIECLVISSNNIDISLFDNFKYLKKISINECRVKIGMSIENTLESVRFLELNYVSKIENTDIVSKFPNL